MSWTRFLRAGGAAIALAGALVAGNALAQPAPAAPAAGGPAAGGPAAGGRDYAAEIEEAVRAAKTAAGFEYLGTMARLCVLPPTNGAPNTADAATPRTPVTLESGPPMANWYADPVWVFDDLVWLGSQAHNSWLLVDPEGYILIDTLFDYNSPTEILGGMARLGLDPANIKYIIISHAHTDHIGGIEAVQDANGHTAPVILGEGDWNMINTRPNAYANGWTPDPNPALRISIPTGGSLETTVGTHTVTSYSTPGHTPGTISHIFKVHDSGREVTVAYAGGTAIGFQTDVPDPGIANLQRYIDSNVNFAAIAEEAGASVLISNHSEFDNAYWKSRMMGSPGRHPFELGEEWVQRYFDVMVNCVRAKQIGLEQVLEKAGG
jgi:metallo-beta-lactamase class B